MPKLTAAPLIPAVDQFSPSEDNLLLRWSTFIIHALDAGSVRRSTECSITVSGVSAQRQSMDPGATLLIQGYPRENRYQGG